MACKIRGLMVTVCPSQFATRRTLFHVLVGCGLLMLKVSRLKLPVIWLLVSMWLNTLTKSQIWTLRSEERFSRNAETDLVCRLLLEKKKKKQEENIHTRCMSCDVPVYRCYVFLFFFFNDTAISWIYTLSLHDALPICRTLFHVLVGCGLLMLKVSRLKLPVIWLLVSMWLNTLTKSQIWTLLLKV